MPRDLLRILLAERAQATIPEMDGEIISRFTLVPFDTGGTLMPVAEVRIGGDIISGVPVAANNQELLEAIPGTPVRLRRSQTGRIEIVGLSKRAFGNTYSFTLVLPRSLPTTSGGLITTSSILISGAVSGFSSRTVTLGELATISGFGFTPLEALALYNQSNTFLRLL